MNDPAILKYIIDQPNAFIESWKAEVGDGTFSLYTPFQPLPAVLFEHGAAQRAGNVLGMDSTSTRSRNCVLQQAFLVFEGGLPRGRQAGERAHRVRRRI